MALTINSDVISNQYSIQQKYADVYKKNSKENPNSLPDNKPNTVMNDIRDISNADLKNFLSVDEKKVLKEVFGDLSVDKESLNLYNSSKSAELLKGSKIDIKL
jgi:hypothetical protein